jgi:predicted alpha/beta hydrolase family esterase
MPRVFLIHGWTGSPDRDWFPWAKSELEKRGYEVFVPELPETAYPKIEPWVAKIKETVGKPRPTDVFAGHSLGCQGILRYLQTLPEGTKVKKVILIAGFEKLKEAAFEVPEDHEIYKPWSKTPIDYPKIKKMVDSWIAVFSDNDPSVPYEGNVEIFKSGLGAKIILEKNMGHFSQGAGVTKLPLLLELIK